MGRVVGREAIRKEVPAEGALLVVQEKVSESIRCQSSVYLVSSAVGLGQIRVEVTKHNGGAVRETSQGFIKMREVG